MTTKKKSPKKPAPKAAKGISQDKLPAIVKRLEAGQTSVITESKTLGFSDRIALRTALREFLGGRAKYEAMLARGMKARRSREQAA